jgi:hypothetical protein
MKHISTSKLKRAVTISSLSLVCWFITSTASAQKFGQSRSHQPGSGRFYFGLESGVGSTSYKFSSNISDLKNLKVVAQGWNAGLSLGDRNFRVKGTYGQYSFKKEEGKSINQKIIGAKANITVPKLFNQTKQLRAYLITGVDFSTFSFDGITITKYIDPKEKLESEEEVCCCPEASVGPPPDPGAPVVDEPGSEDILSTAQGAETVPSKSVSYQKAQINAGLGAEFMLASNGKYFKMFAESYYGMPLKAIADVNMSKTKVSGQLVINIGVAIGINR